VFIIQGLWINHSFAAGSYFKLGQYWKMHPIFSIISSFSLIIVSSYDAAPKHYKLTKYNKPVYSNDWLMLPFHWSGAETKYAVIHQSHFLKSTSLYLIKPYDWWIATQLRLSGTAELLSDHQLINASTYKLSGRNIIHLTNCIRTCRTFTITVT
jgi:hypothetical protein